MSFWDQVTFVGVSLQDLLSHSHLMSTTYVVEAPWDFRCKRKVVCETH